MSKFLNDILPNITGPWDIAAIILDLLLVTYLIYRVLLLIKGTRAVPILIGLAVIVIGFYVSKQFELHTSQWVLETFTGSFLLFIIVVFQEDIRRGLARVGRRSIFSRFGGQTMEVPIEELIRAAIALAEKKIGGLIVIEREASLDEFLLEGTRLDATISRELIYSIFHTESPIHDGAVIIQNDRIIAAGCFLPLTHNPRISRFLGTRHRAAIGVTEENDAVVIIISEETGNISVAIDGILQRGLDKVALRNLLNALFGGRGRKRKAAKSSPKEAS